MMDVKPARGLRNGTEDAVAQAAAGMDRTLT